MVHGQAGDAASVSTNAMVVRFARPRASVESLNAATPRERPDMHIPFSSRRARANRRAPAPGIPSASRIPYVHTALAYQWLPDNGDGEAGMGLLEHLDELRTRLIRCAVAIGAGMLVAFAFIERVVGFVLAPARHALPAGVTLIYTLPGEAFGLYIEVAMIAGALLAAPYLMYQVWRFIAPGLYANEKRLAIPFVVLTTIGALSGAAFNHYVFFPAMIAFFGTFNSSTLLFMPRVEDMFDLYTKMLLGMCAVFQIPTVAYFLARMRLVTARFLWRNFKYAFLLIFIVAAVLTPTTDPWDQMVFAAPMVGLYLLSIGIVWAAYPKRSAV
jgi:sec-independent protein translocase protein TatC